jgi:hypothetical protein
MPYTLEQFCADNHAALTSGQPLSKSLADIERRLSTLLKNPQFVAETFNDDTPAGRRVLHHDKDTDVYVLAHVQEAPKKGSPHNHGHSWAVYGTAREVTRMTEWKRVNPETEEKAELVPVANYDLGPGDTHAYGPGVLHSTEHPRKAWVIRVTGTDVDAIPRYRFKPERDRIVERA